MLDRYSNIISLSLLLAVFWGFWRGFYEAPVDVNQGEVYRVIFLHVPAAMASFFAAFVLFIGSMIGIAKKSDSALRWQKSAAEIGLVFTVITLATGSIWGRPTWGTWWVWDARLTTTLLLALLLGGYLILYQSFMPGISRIRSCSILGIIIFADIPIIYKSVDWWRTLHQGHTMFDREKSPMSPEIKSVFFYCIIVVLIYCLWLIRERSKVIAMQEKIVQLSMERVK
jgi:heme exporter protein C